MPSENSSLALSGILGPRAAEDASDHVDVPFVARELVDVVLGCTQAHDGCPWFHPRRRIPAIFSNTAQTAAVSSDGFFLVAAA